MAFDKVIDSAVLEANLTSVADAIRAKSGTSEALAFPSGFVAAVEELDGGGLNFEVIGGTTEPTNPKENTIWVNTDQEITGYSLSVAEPENPADGMVWIFIGASSPGGFSITKKNPIMVYPISAKQYVSGAWVDVTAKSYQNGEWLDWWSGELLTPNNTWDNITGGWVGDGKMPVYTDDNFTYVSPVVTHTADAINFKNSVSRCAGSYHTVNKVDISKFSQIVIEVKSLTCTNGYFALYIDDDLSGKVKQNAVAFTDVIKGGANTNYTGSAFIDVSTQTGEFYVGIAYQCYSGTFDADVEIIFMK